MPDLSFIGDAIRFPLILLRDVILFAMNNMVPLIITLFFLFFLFWFFSSGVRERLIDYFIKRREEKHAIRRLKH